MTETEVLSRLMRPLSRSLTADLARALIGLHADDETQSRYEELADKRTEGSLSREEAEELEAIVRANTLLGVLKAEAQLFLGDRTAA